MQRVLDPLVIGFAHIQRLADIIRHTDSRPGLNVQIADGPGNNPGTIAVGYSVSDNPA